MSLSNSMPDARSPQTIAALAALVAGALAMGVSPVFVRLADVGPFASAFWRVGLAIPLLAVWALFDGGIVQMRAAFRSKAVWLAGVFFTIDLFFWHLAIKNTTIANATFLACMAPIWVLLGSRAFIGEKIPRTVVLGIITCIAGGALLVGQSYTLEPDRFLGDLYGIGTSFGFGCYFLAVRVARRDLSSGAVTFGSTVITAGFLLLVALALEPRVMPATLIGLETLIALAWISHSGGQGLLAFALGHLSAAFSSLVIFMEALAAAFIAWLVFDERIGAGQAVGGLLILYGIYSARPRG
ncbi:DMT family transporter [Oryzibacter oryziterrae]|uniref:DMT family transporter n=1 Tax=Oryzibacter oryziterrae TaxID=2766474 RepID=UPI001F3D9018|nr:DMT family transporter [Oryzibacter oryziterrae]